MKAIVCSGYILITLLYFALDYSRFTGALFLIGQTMLIAFLSHQLSEVTSGDIDKIALKYLEYLSLANIAYIVICYIRGAEFAIHNTDIFAYVLGISFVVMAVHIAYFRGEK